jgi:hypothetical protein
MVKVETDSDAACAKFVDSEAVAYASYLSHAIEKIRCNKVVLATKSNRRLLKMLADDPTNIVCVCSWSGKCNPTPKKAIQSSNPRPKKAIHHSRITLQNLHTVEIMLATDAGVVCGIDNIDGNMDYAFRHIVPKPFQKSPPLAGPFGMYDHLFDGKNSQTTKITARLRVPHPVPLRIEFLNCATVTINGKGTSSRQPWKI